MITVKELLTEKTTKSIHIALLSEKPTVTAVANLHHVLSQSGAKSVYHTPAITPEIKSLYQNSGINHKHFFAVDGEVSTIFHAIDNTKKKSDSPIVVHVHPSSVKDVTKHVKDTHPNTIITVKALPHEKGASKEYHPSIKKSDIKLMKEDISIGDYVTNGKVDGEIISIHPTYAVITSEGKEHRVWTKDLSLSENSLKRNQLFKNSFIYKGYKTSHFNRSLSESFKEISKNEKDEYAVLECIKVFDYLLGVGGDTITENFKVVRIQVERLKRYSSKIRATYLTEAVSSVVEEELLKYSLIEDVKFTTTDVNAISRVISFVAGIPYEKSSGSPTNIMNQATMKLRTLQLTTQGWVVIGKLLKVARMAGIKFNIDTFSDSQLKMMNVNK